MWLDRWQQRAPAWEAIHLPAEQPARSGDRVLIRPAKAADAAGVQAFVRGLSPETRRKRFFGPIAELSPEQLERLTSCASANHLNLLALDPGYEIVGMAQCVTTEDAEAEFALLVADAWQRRGIGTALYRMLLQHARKRGLALLNGFVLTDNRPMLGFAAKLGFSLFRDTDATLTRVVMPVGDPWRPALD